MGVVEAYRLAATSVRAEVKVGERFVANVGQVKVSVTDCVAREA